MNEENNKLDKLKKGIENVLIDMIKEFFKEMFRAQEETIRKIVSSCKTDKKARLDRLTGEF